MKKEIKILYKKDPKLAKQVAKVLGYKIMSAMKDELGKFWVVVKPEQESTLDDILFLVDIPGIMKQTREAFLHEDYILGIFKNKSKAEKLAKSEIQKNLENIRKE